MAHDLAAKAHEHGAAVLAGLPGEAVGEPVVRALHLTAALDVLAEEAVAIAHAVAVAGDALVGHGVEEARGEAAQATVAKARVDLLAADVLEAGSQLLDALGDEVTDAKVDQVVVEQGTEQELEGEVVDLLGALGVGLREEGTTLVGDELGEREVALLARQLLEGGAVAVHAGLAVLLDEVFRALENLGGSHCLAPQYGRQERWVRAGARGRLPRPAVAWGRPWAAPSVLCGRREAHAALPAIRKE